MNDCLTGARPAGFPETRTGSKPHFEPVTVSGRSIRPSAESTRNRSFMDAAANFGLPNRALSGPA